jgi:hypothetical protein
MTGNFVIGFEAIPILTAETLQLLKPGFGSEAPDSQLSNYWIEQEPDVSDHYPVEEELKLLGIDIGVVEKFFETLFNLYNKWRGKNFNGPLPEFFRKKYGHLAKKQDLEKGIIGETCDVLGNFAPACILTSVGLSFNECDLPDLMRNLLSNQTPANIAIVDMLRVQADDMGYDLTRHINLSPWHLFHNQPLSVLSFSDLHRRESHFLAEYVYKTLTDVFLAQGLGNWENQLKLKINDRRLGDCLPDAFKAMNFGVYRRISFRGWLGLLKWKFDVRKRTFITPKFGFYSYLKSAPEDLENDFLEVYGLNQSIWQMLEEKNAPLNIREGLMLMGNQVGCYISGSLWLWESVIEQATRFDNHHEVRNFFLKVYNSIAGGSACYPYLRPFFRVDAKENYLFAAMDFGIELPDLKNKKEND